MHYNEDVDGKPCRIKNKVDVLTKNINCTLFKYRV